MGRFEEAAMKHYKNDGKFNLNMLYDISREYINSDFTSTSAAEEYMARIFKAKTVNEALSSCRRLDELLFDQGINTKSVLISMTDLFNKKPIYRKRIANNKQCKPLKKEDIKELLERVEEVISKFIQANNNKLTFFHSYGLYYAVLTLLMNRGYNENNLSLCYNGNDNSIDISILDNSSIYTFSKVKGGF